MSTTKTMTQSVKSLLQTAFNNSALIWAHIDLQKVYSRDGDLDPVFQICAGNAETARQHSIPNLWVATTFKHIFDKAHKGTVKEKDLIGQQKFHIATPQTTEKIYPKHRADASQNTQLISDINEQASVLIIDGVHADECLIDSLTGIFQRLPHIHIVLASDATNLSTDEETFERTLRNKQHFVLRRDPKVIDTQFHMMKSNDIAEALKEVAPRQP